MQSLDSLLKDALLLSAEDRALLADALDESLGTSKPDVVAEWTAEIDYRIEDFTNGRSAITAEESLDRVQRSLSTYRKKRETQ